ncbi:MAG: DUF6458 family protein [Egibacteraceae bacterium]
MGFRSSLSLITVGAILAFAVQVDFSGLDVQVVGFILMLAGVIGMALTFRLRRGRQATDPVTETAWTDEPEPIHQDHDHNYDNT